VIPGLDPGHAPPDRVDDAGALVAADDREAHPRVALLDVVVGVAQPGRVELDPDLVGLRLVELEVGDLPGWPGTRQTAARVVMLMRTPFVGLVHDAPR